jgi:hypothetical protein
MARGVRNTTAASQLLRSCTRLHGRDDALRHGGSGGEVEGLVENERVGRHQQALQRQRIRPRACARHVPRPSAKAQRCAAQRGARTQAPRKRESRTARAKASAPQLEAEKKRGADVKRSRLPCVGHRAHASAAAASARAARVRRVMRSAALWKCRWRRRCRSGQQPLQQSDYLRCWTGAGGCAALLNEGAR